jgi:hypothetical protein
MECAASRPGGWCCFIPRPANIAYRLLARSALGEAAALFALPGFACAFAYGFGWLIERPSTALRHRVHLSQPGAALGTGITRVEIAFRTRALTISDMP